MKGLCPTSILFLLFVVPLFSAPVEARVYSWVDEHGVTHYGDKVPRKYRKESSKVELRGKVSTYSSEVVPSTSYGKVSKPSAAPRSGSVTSVRNSSKRNEVSRHTTGTRHATDSRHRSPKQSQSYSRHATRSRYNRSHPQ